MRSLIPVVSSNIAAIGWTARLDQRVDFHGGRSYIYRTAPEGIFNALIEAESVGKAFNILVKQHPTEFQATRVLTEREPGE